jgi:hypothetical protein
MQKEDLKELCNNSIGLSRIPLFMYFKKQGATAGLAILHMLLLYKASPQ